MIFHIALESYEHKYKYKHLALYHALKDAILSGTLPYEMKLPSSRKVAKQYTISRGVVMQVYEMLAAEGYLLAKAGSGTYIDFQRIRKGSSQTEVAINSTLQLSQWGQRVNEWSVRQMSSTVDHDVTFRIGIPAMEHFPLKEWNRIVHIYSKNRNRLEKEPVEALGHLSLREAISYYLKRARGIHTHVDNIAIVNGSMQAIALLCQLLIDPGDQVIVEEPSYIGTRLAILAAGGNPIPRPVEQQGMSMKNLESARLAYVTPSRQFPTGVVLSLEKRLELLEWAAHQEALIIEDDYDSEFRHKGRPIEPLKVLDTSNRVAYIGTFSKTLLPDIRIGYVVLPSKMSEPFCKAKQLFEPHPTSILEQRVVAEFIKSGEYEKHLRKMRRIYSHKHKIMEKLLREQLSHRFDVVQADAGLHIFAWWKGEGASYEDLIERCKREGVTWTDATEYILGEGRHAACFGFSHLSEDEMRKEIEIIAQIAK